MWTMTGMLGAVTSPWKAALAQGRQNVRTLHQPASSVLVGNWQAWSSLFSTLLSLQLEATTSKEGSWCFWVRNLLLSCSAS